MSTEAEEIQRRASAAVRDMLNEYRLQAAGPVSDQASWLLARSFLASRQPSTSR